MTNIELTEEIIDREETLSYLHLDQLELEGFPPFCSSPPEPIRGTEECIEYICLNRGTSILV